MYRLARQLLFCLPTELAHDLALGSLDLAYKSRLLGGGKPDNSPATDPVKLFGLEFPNRIGLAAGLDKDAEHIPALAALGFGFIEVGTVTPRAQPGNARPRLFRLREHEALINRMGFNNHGVDELIARVEAAAGTGIVGINIGKNKDTPTERAIDDYLICMRKAYAVAAYITVNLSSPNTPGLRDLQFGKPLTDLLKRLKQEQAALHSQYGSYKALLVKLAPDLAHEDVQRIAEVLLEQQIDGVIAGNTTVSRSEVAGHAHAEEEGGLSGKPLAERATRLIARLHAELKDEIPIVGVGGIHDEHTAREKLQAGAQLLQIYTGFIYQGPGLIPRLVAASQS